MELTQTEAYIKQEEGYRRHMYKCPSGKWTIGIGLNLEAGLPEDEAETILRLRLDKVNSLPPKGGSFEPLPPARRLMEPR